VIPRLQLTQSRPAFSQTNTLINRIHILVIGTTCLTAVAAIITAALYVAGPDHAYQCPLVMLSQLYGNSALLSINNRVLMRRDRTEQCDLPLVRRLNSREELEPRSSHRDRRVVGSIPQIVVAVHQECHVDESDMKASNF